MSDFVDKLIGGVTSKASAAAADVAAVQWERSKPFVYAAVFMAVTAWVFFFIPRFRLPWERA